MGEIDPDNVLVRNNSMNGVVEFADASVPSRFEVLGNIGLGPHGCPSGATFRQNLWETDFCEGAPDLVGVPHFRISRRTTSTCCRPRRGSTRFR